MPTSALVDTPSKVCGGIFLEKRERKRRHPVLSPNTSLDGS
jgi:hypothetical protein